MLEQGIQAPNFVLPDQDGTSYPSPITEESGLSSDFLSS